MPDQRVRTRSSPGAGSRSSTGRISTRLGATNRSARASTGSLYPAPPPPNRRTRLRGTPDGNRRPVSRTLPAVDQIASLTLPTPFGEWEVRAFEWADSVHLCLIRGEIGDGEDVLVRMHSECVTGDALGSLRCDCGVQLRHAFRSVAAEG